MWSDRLKKVAEKIPGTKITQYYLRRHLHRVIGSRRHLCPKSPETFSSQNSFWDRYGTFDDQGLFSVKITVFRNFFDFAQIWGILESDKLWEIQCWRVADGKDESW